MYQSGIAPFSGIDIDVVDRGPGVGLAHRRYPGDVAVDHQDDIRLGERLVLDRLVPLVALVERVVMRVVHAIRHGFEHADAEAAA